MYKNVYKWIRADKYKRLESNGYISISTPVIFRQNASPDVLQPLVILSIQIFSTAQYSIGFRNTWSKVLWWTMSGWRIRLSVLLSSTHPRYARQHVPCLFAGDLPPAGSQPTVSPLRWRCCFTRPRTPFFIRLFYFFNRWRKKLTINFTNNQTAIKINLFI